jgi:hypothetical protein
MKFAVTFLFVFIATVHVIPLTESQPVHPLKIESSAGDAVSVTTVPLLKSAAQFDPQLIPAGADVTVPPKIPVVETLSVTRTMKLLALVPVPAAVVTLSGPLVAPAGTVAWIVVGDATVNAAAVPLNLTAVAPPKFDPLIVTVAPASALVGVKLVINGATAKLAALVTAPPAAVTLSGPVVAPAGTVV